MHSRSVKQPFPRNLALAVAAALLLGTAWTAAQAPEPIVYTLRFPKPSTHYVEIEAEVPTGRKQQIELMMAVWTPGSYLIREFERNVEGLVARTRSGQAASVHKTRKNRWAITTAGEASVIVSYRVYCREMSVRTNWIEDGFALLNGAPTFLTLVEPDAKRPHDVRIELPAAWRSVVTALPRAAGNAPTAFRAPDFDTLVDSPIVLGTPAIHEFEVAGKPHYLVNTNEGGVFDGHRAATDVQRIVEQNRQFWGGLPYDRYWFLNMIVEAGGGLEHRDSQVIMSGRFATRIRRTYVNWLTLVSHEFFHAWNVKRLRPIELGPFDYEHEVHTKSLWIAEGLTDYYGHLQLRRTGLTTESEFLDALSDAIERLETTPGRLVLPLEQASYDAWIKFYRPDENSSNTSVSYYTKGEVVGFLLDATIRRATGGARGLDDVMREAYQRFSGARGYTSSDFRNVAREIAGTELEPFFVRALETTEDLSYDDALDWYGLRFKPAEASSRAALGISTRTDAGGRLLVSQVRRETPAYDAGLDVDDEIIAIDEFRVHADQLEARLERYRPAERVTLLVSRRDELRRIPVVLGTQPPRRWRLEISPNASSEQRQRLAAWQNAVQ
jgi:predicted metalloprotease with PDZ domain